MPGSPLGGAASPERFPEGGPSTLKTSISRYESAFNGFTVLSAQNNTAWIVGWISLISVPCAQLRCTSHHLQLEPSASSSTHDQRN
jgi:hypothetical protein